MCPHDRALARLLRNADTGCHRNAPSHAIPPLLVRPDEANPHSDNCFVALFAGSMRVRVRVRVRVCACVCIAERHLAYMTFCTRGVYPPPPRGGGGFER